MPASETKPRRSLSLVRGAASLAWLAAVLIGAGCGGGILKEYEYDEEVFLDLDGSATILINASIPALVALRGLDADPDPQARLDRDRIRAFYETPVTRVTRVSRPWRREGRRFVQVRLETDDFAALEGAAPFSWSVYQLDRRGEEFYLRQEVGGAVAVPPPGVNWDGDELVAFRLHLPSRIFEHNTTSRTVNRGNILVWEQTLGDRLAGKPLVMYARMEAESILARTLSIFALAFVAALAVLGGAIWWVVKKA
jgi:hypothetical protein